MTDKAILNNGDALISANKNCVTRVEDQSLTVRKAGDLFFKGGPDKVISCHHTGLVFQSNANMVVRCFDAANNNIGLTFSSATGGNPLNFQTPLTLTLRDDCVLRLTDAQGRLMWDSVNLAAAGG
jgi:hypothetical protein